VARQFSVDAAGRQGAASPNLAGKSIQIEDHFFNLYKMNHD
jgi:hypothetical protein